ncbi:MAG: hypothetical protein ACK5TR_06010 [Alphaproteobacteria bacterium]|jgi:hypothetical protein|nr:hypothetical protein [Alphaproteobacteria bacterium]
MTIKSFVCVAVLTVFMPLWASDADEGKEISIAVSTSPISPSLVLHTSSDGEEDSDLEAQRKTPTTAATSTKKRNQNPKKPLTRGTLDQDDEREIEDKNDEFGGLYGMRVIPNPRGLPLRLEGDDLEDDPTVLPMRDIQARETLLKRLQEQDARRWTFGVGFYSNLSGLCSITGEVLKGIATTFGGVALAVGSPEGKDWFNYAVVLCGTFGQSFLVWSEKAGSAAKQRRYDIEKLSGYHVRTVKLKSALCGHSDHSDLLKRGMARSSFMAAHEEGRGPAVKLGSFEPVEDETVLPMDPAAGQAIFDDLQQQDAERWLWSEAFYGWSSSILGTAGNMLSGVSTALAGASLFTGDEQTKQWYSFGVVLSGAAGSLCSYLSSKAKSASKQRRADLEKMAGVEATLPPQDISPKEDANAL